jgi:hypothetical protein
MGPPPTLHIYVVHAPTLTLRAARIHGVIQELRTTAMARGYEVRPVLLVKNNADDIAGNLQAIQACINYDPVGDPEFDNLRQLLNLEVLSNIEKHKDAWKRICEAARATPGDLHLVIEDDAYLLPGALANFGDLLAYLKQDAAPSWDLLFLGIARPDVSENAPISLVPLQDTLQAGRILPCKESYLLTPQTAQRLLDAWATYRYPLRTQLSYVLATTSPTITAFHPNHRIMLDGSKVGIHPSTIHPNNALVFNREYMQLLAFLQRHPDEVERNMPAIRTIYKQLAHMNNPDVMHLYGVLLLKLGRFADAEEVLVGAMKHMSAQQGLLNNRSDLMNNLITAYQNMQGDLPALLRAPSIYDDPSLATPA